MDILLALRRMAHRAYTSTIPTSYRQHPIPFPKPNANTQRHKRKQQNSEEKRPQKRETDAADKILSNIVTVSEAKRVYSVGSFEEQAFRQEGMRDGEIGDHQQRVAERELEEVAPTLSRVFRGEADA